MASGKQPITLEVLLIGVLGRCLFHLSEANVVIDYYRPYTPRSLAKRRHKWRDFAGQIRREVKWRAERLPAPPEGKARLTLRRSPSFPGFYNLYYVELRKSNGHYRRKCRD